jgi:threonyl-tRNA synthetase
LERLAKEDEEADGYHRVVTPHIAKEELYITSGHLPYYADEHVSTYGNGWHKVLFPSYELSASS